MIQRIQTIWLIFSTVVPISLIDGGIIKFVGKSGEKYQVGFHGIYKLAGTEYNIIKDSIGLPVTIVLISLLSLVTIFLFKFRKVQKVLTLTVIALSLILVILLAFYSYQTINEYNGSIQIGLLMFSPVVLLLTSVMAYRGIVKDESIIKSYDRIR
jgi:hypothetical protein